MCLQRISFVERRETDQGGSSLSSLRNVNVEPTVLVALAIVSY